MGRRFTFIHAADLHLGASLRSLHASSPQIARLLSHATISAFERLIQEAVSRSVDLVILAGDVFDRKEPSFAEYMRFHDGLKLLDEAGIQVFIVSGNHDPQESWANRFAEMPGNVRTAFSEHPDYLVVSREGAAMAAVVGRGFTLSSGESGSDLLSGMDRASVLKTCGSNVPFVLGALHTGLNVDASVAPIGPHALRSCNLDYWALGHLHAPACDSTQNPQIVFPGCLQGHDINEPGRHGCFVVTLEEGHSNKVDFIPLASIVWERANVDVSACVTIEDVCKSVLRELMRIARGSGSERLLARVSLTGESSLYSELSRPDVLEGIRERLNDASLSFYCDEVTNGTRLPIDRQAIREEGLFPAELLRHSQELMHDTDSAKRYLRDSFAARGMTSPEFDDDEVISLCRQAEILVLDMLQGS